MTDLPHDQLNPQHQTEGDLEYYRGMASYFGDSLGDTLDKLRNFPKYVPRQWLGTFLAKYEIFKRMINSHGYIIECGVHLGGGLLTWAQLSSMMEPINHIRRIVGFDTFDGFTPPHRKDQGVDIHYKKEGGLAARSLDDLKECLRLYDVARPLGHIPRVELVAGDATKTIPTFVEKNPHLVISLLYLDFDLYEPTKAALTHFVPRMPKGAIIAFDQLNHPVWPGETSALLDTLGIRSLRLERFPFTPQLSFAVLD